MKKLILIFSVVVIGIILTIVVLAVLHGRGTPAEEGGSTPTTFPSGGTNGGGGSSTQVMEVPVQSGESITTKDFIHNGVTFEDPSNAGQYYLAGSNGVCKADGTCPTAGTSTNFVIIYSSHDHSFVIGLTTEPLGSVRKQAEQYLMDMLGITEAQMCALNYTIGTTSYINPTYGGENLGFSFCPGAVRLP